MTGRVARSRLAGRLAMGALLASAAFITVATPGAAQTTTDVSIVSIEAGFEADPVEIDVGDSITWTNVDEAAPHTATATGVSPAFDSGLMTTGQTFTHTFDTPGAFAYICTIHPNMEGTVVVNDVAFGAIGDRVWDDTDADGIQDDGEPGLADVVIDLIGGGADGTIGTDDDTQETTVSFEGGFYAFFDLRPGVEYQVTFNAPSGFGFTLQDAGDDDIDSDADPASGTTPVFTLTDGQDDPTIDAGFVELPPMPSVDLEKSTNGDDADDAPGPEIPAGSPVAWTFAVANNGNVDLVDITVTDDQLGDVCTITVLAAAAETSCTMEGIATLGQHTNTGSVSATPSGGGDEVTDSDVSHYLGIEALGTIVIVLDTQPDDGRDIEFTAAALNPSTFTLDDDDDPTLSDTMEFLDVPAGSIDISQTSEADLRTSVVCDDPDGGSTTDAASAVVDLDMDETVTCTFTNILNTPPIVDAGEDIVVTLPDDASLIGTATDDGLPEPPAAVTVEWSQVSGPATAAIADSSALETTVAFAQAGTYVLRLTADDGIETGSDEIRIDVTGVLGIPLVACPTDETPFTDIATSFAELDIRCVYGLDIAQGTTDTTYGPLQPVTRQQMAAFLARLWRARGGVCPVDLTPLVDIAASFAEADIRCVYGLDIAQGTTDTTYGPLQPVTRQQMAALLARLWRALGGTCPTDETPFTDIAASFAEADIRCVYGLDIAQGTTDTTYGPLQPVTRQQMAAFLARLWRTANDNLLFP